MSTQTDSVRKAHLVHAVDLSFFDESEWYAVERCLTPEMQLDVGASVAGAIYFSC